MGLNGSKLAERPAEKPNTEETGSIPSTPILALKLSGKDEKNDENLDPRSPSKHIARTPIELLSAAADKLSTLTIETTDLDNIAVETPLKQHLILGVDPRSPTLEVQRTPIVVSASPDKKLPGRIRNKNLEKVKGSALLSTPKNTAEPKLLDSSAATQKIPSDVYKRKSFVLLETNVDFTETDLDTVIRQKYSVNSLENLPTSVEETYHDVTDPRSPTTDFFQTPVQVCRSTNSFTDHFDREELDIITEHTAQNMDNNNDSSKACAEVITDDETPKVREESELGIIQSEEPEGAPSCHNENLSQDSSSDEENEYNENATAHVENLVDTEAEDKHADYNHLQTEHEKVDTYANDAIQKERELQSEAVISLTPSKKLTSLSQEILLSPALTETLPQLHKSAPVSPPDILNLTPKKSKSEPVTPPFIDLTADVKELDKKLTNLIYEDEDLVVCPKVVRVKDKSRTPLGLRNDVDNRKNTQKLKVSDKPRKSLYAVSKIPVFKEKKVKVQCENIPPRGMRGTKAKKSQWDSKDDTLVI